MATSMEADSEVLFKEKREGKGVKTETAVDDATLQLDFRASTPATSPPGREAEHRGQDGEEHRRIELKKFSLKPEKYDSKGDFEGWVNQFEEYASSLGQWTEEEISCCRNEKKWRTRPEWRPSGVGLDKKRTPASHCKSWPD